eukprot:5400240-Pyramimonas_sp.AAC.1
MPFFVTVGVLCLALGLACPPTCRCGKKNEKGDMPELRLACRRRRPWQADSGVSPRPAGQKARKG